MAHNPITVKKTSICSFCRDRRPYTASDGKERPICRQCLMKRIIELENLYTRLTAIRAALEVSHGKE